MTELAIGFGSGLAVAIATTVLFFILLRNQQGETRRANDRADSMAKKLDDKVADCSDLESERAILQTNQSELEREIALKQTKVDELTARVASVQKARDDLADVLKQNPGAVTAAVGVAFDRLREELSRAQAASAAPAQDRGAGEAGAVHEGSKRPASP